MLEAQDSRSVVKNPAFLPKIDVDRILENSKVIDFVINKLEGNPGDYVDILNNVLRRKGFSGKLTSSGSLKIKLFSSNYEGLGMHLDYKSESYDLETSIILTQKEILEIYNKNHI